MVTALEFSCFTRKCSVFNNFCSSLLVSVYLEQLDYRMLKNLRLTVYGWHT